MKLISQYICLLLTVTLVSCEKVIDLTLNDNTLKYVIEGTITNEPRVCQVLISQTKDFKDDNQFKGVSGAVVTIESNGIVTTLSEISNGIYSSTKINGAPGQTYHLTVRVNGEVFTASSTMPDMVPFLDFTLKPSDYDSTETTPMVKFRDVAGVANYYWFQQYVNDNIQSQYTVLNDEYTNGQEVNAYLTFENTTKDPGKNFKRGDRLTAEMHCIDASVYTYLFSLSNANGSSDEGAAPSNPLSNINGGALGFFSAHTVQRKTIMLP